jgi:hypothetical protein
MGNPQSVQAKQAEAVNRNLSNQYYGVAIPALAERQNAIQASLAQGEPQYVKSAFAGQRTGLQEGLAAQAGAAQANQMESSKRALSGGNAFADLHPADAGAKLADALWGSKYAESQGSLNQNLNLLNMALGGSGMAGNSAMQAAGQQLSAIGHLPNYNQTYANIAGGAAGLSSIYGSLNTSYPQLFGPAGTTNTGAMLPGGWSSSSFVGGATP